MSDARSFDKPEDASDFANEKIAESRANKADVDECVTGEGSPVAMLKLRTDALLEEAGAAETDIVMVGLLIVRNSTDDKGQHCLGGQFEVIAPVIDAQSAVCLMVDDFPSAVADQVHAAFTGVLREAISKLRKSPESGQ